MLCEVHDGEELQRALDAGCDLIGVNSRDLRTFKSIWRPLSIWRRRFPMAWYEWRRVEFIRREDVARLRDAGYSAFLVGESLMRAARLGRHCGIAGCERKYRVRGSEGIECAELRSAGILRLRFCFAFREAKSSLRMTMLRMTDVQ